MLKMFFKRQFGGYCYVHHWQRMDCYSDYKRIFKQEVELPKHRSGSWQWFSSSCNCKTALRHTVPKQLKSFSRQHARFHQLTRMDTAFARSESTRLLYLGIGTYCKDLCTKEGVNRLQTSKILTLLSEKNGMMSMIRQCEKLFCSEKRRLAIVAKQNGGPIQHISAS